jgi:hypothetical protein
MHQQQDHKQVTIPFPLSQTVNIISEHILDEDA